MHSFFGSQKRGPRSSSEKRLTEWDVDSALAGMQTVPTLRFDDGSALTNPSIVQVKAHLAALAA